MIIQTRRSLLSAFGGLALKATVDEPAPFTTKIGGFINGRLWNAQSEGQRACLVLGAIQGLRWSLVVQALMGNSTGTKDFATLIDAVIPKLNSEELAKAITIYYSDPTNLAIPVTAMIGIVSQKIGGSKPEDLEKSLAGFRLTFKE